MKFKLTVHTIQEMGQRNYQEDSIFPKNFQANSSDRLFILCDGTGGHNAGDFCSQTVCEVLSRDITANAPAEGAFSDEVFKAALEKAYEAIDAKEDERRMGTTLAFLKLHDAGATIAHVGDSRIYHFRPTAAKRQLFRTEDHSLANEMVKNGEMSPEEARNSKERNILTRAIQPNQKRHTQAEIHHIDDIQSGDYFFLCSDGMLEMTDDAQLGYVITNQSYTDLEKIQILTRQTEINHDNHSAILVHITQVIEEEVVPCCETPAEEAVVETPVEEPVVETPVEEPVVETPVEEPVAETMVEEPVAETMVEEPVAETPAETNVVDKVQQIMPSVAIAAAAATEEAVAEEVISEIPAADEEKVEEEEVPVIPAADEEVEEEEVPETPATEEDVEEEEVPEISAADEEVEEEEVPEISAADEEVEEEEFSEIPAADEEIEEEEVPEIPAADEDVEEVEEPEVITETSEEAEEPAEEVAPRRPAKSKLYPEENPKVSIWTRIKNSFAACGRGWDKMTSPITNSCKNWWNSQPASVRTLAPYIGIGVLVFLAVVSMSIYFNADNRRAHDPLMDMKEPTNTTDTLTDYDDNDFGEAPESANPDAYDKAKEDEDKDKDKQNVPAVAAPVAAPGAATPGAPAATTTTPAATQQPAPAQKPVEKPVETPKTSPANDPASGVGAPEEH